MRVIQYSLGIIKCCQVEILIRADVILACYYHKWKREENFLLRPSLAMNKCKCQSHDCYWCLMKTYFTYTHENLTVIQSFESQKHQILSLMRKNKNINANTPTSTDVISKKETAACYSASIIFKIQNITFSHLFTMCDLHDLIFRSQRIMQACPLRFHVSIDWRGRCLM